MVRPLIALLGLSSLLACAALPGRAQTASSPTPAPEAPQPPEVRERMAELLLLPKDKLWKELSKWPSFQRMTLDEQSAFLGRMALMRKETQKKALDHAVKIGLTIPADKHEAFTDDYLRERIHLHRKFVAENRKGKTPSPEAFDKELDRRLTKKYGPVAVSAPPSAPESSSALKTP